MTAGASAAATGIAAVETCRDLRAFTLAATAYNLIRLPGLHSVRHVLQVNRQPPDRAQALATPARLN
jgi:hypothetical protein